MDLLIGGTLLAFPLAGIFFSLVWTFGFLVFLGCLPLGILPLGYTIRRLERIINLQRPAVAWDRQVGLTFLIGTRAAVVVAAYLALPVALMAFSRFLVIQSAGGAFFSISLLRGQLLETIAAVLLLIACFFLPPALWALAEEEGNLRSAFRINDLLDRIFLIPRDYLIVYVVNLGIFLPTAVLILLVLNPVAAVILGGFVIFYDWLVSAHLMGKIFPRRTVQIRLSLTEIDSSET